MILLATLIAGTVIATATADRAELRLSGHAIVTLTIEGDTPLRVSPPAAWLPGDEAWRLRPLGPARVEDLSPTRQRWTLQLRADPDAAGELPLQLPPVRVTAGSDAQAREVPFPALTLRVVATVVLGRDTPRPPTDLEEPAAEPAPPDAPVLWVAALVSVTVLALVVGRRRRVAQRMVADDPRAEFGRALADLGAVGVPDAEFSARLSAAVRGYVEAAGGLPALRRTPRELVPLTDGAARLANLPELLQRCDDARFSDAPLDAEARAVLLASAAKLAGGPP